MDQSDKPNMLLFGMPEAHSSYWEVNIAQGPQEPILKEFLLLPEFIRKQINDLLKYTFNPEKEAPYMGLNLIKQNLRDDFNDITLINYPNEKEIMELVRQKIYSVIGISIGCENRIEQARDLAQKIKEIDPDIKIVFGNYGATTGKLEGILDDKVGTVLWDNPEERVEKSKKNEESYTGEGIHDMRLYLKKNGFSIQANPNDHFISEPVPNLDLISDNKIVKLLKEKLGLTTMPMDMHNLATSIGCSNGCSFCNTTKQFNRQKTFLFSSPDEMYNSITDYIKNIKDNDTNHIPEYSFALMDENFMKPNMENAERIFQLVEESGENIRWTTFGDLGSLRAYKEKHKDFKGLVRGGLTTIWIGLESKADFFHKRGGATIPETEEIVKELQSLGISVIGSFIVGLPIHTEEKTKQNVDESYEALNIWEDIDWWIERNTAFNQVMIMSTTDLVAHINKSDNKKEFYKINDLNYGHIAEDNMPCVIPKKRLEEIDKKAREMFYQKNGPASLRSLLTIWDGFKNFKDSENPAEIRAANYYYWSAKRYLHLLSLSTLFFSDKIFEKCSDEFLNRLATFFVEIEELSPPNTNLHEEYEQIFKIYDNQIFKISKLIAKKMREKFVKKNKILLP